ncbi:MAG TPA: C-GCAxxG-C-C family protein [Syntrophorhabdaceae bacterium]|nr:C-GCAxxG-C-C family protein [Syntrophorhabdaceae bacterium]
MNKVERARLTFDSGFNCAQSVLHAFCHEFGLDEAQAFKIACAFGGGMDKMAKTCGAVTGSFMVISLKYGKTRSDDKQAKETTNSFVKRFADLFVSEHGSIECRELLGCDISTSQGFSFAQQKGLFKTSCPNYVESAVKILEKLL